MLSVVVKRTAYQVICLKAVLFSWISKLLSGFSLLKSFAFLISPNWRPELSVKERGGFFFTASRVRVCAVALVHSFSFGKKQRFQKAAPFLTPHISALREDIFSVANNKWKNGEDKSSGDQNTRVWQMKKQQHTCIAFTLALVWYAHAGKLHSHSCCAQEDDIKWS